MSSKREKQEEVKPRDLKEELKLLQSQFEELKKEKLELERKLAATQLEYERLQSRYMQLESVARGAESRVQQLQRANESLIFSGR